MKNKKKVIACLMSIGILGSLTLVPTDANAIIHDTSTISEEVVQYYKENAITEAILILEDAGENSGTYYWKNTESNGLPIKIDDTFDTSSIETIIIVSKIDKTIDDCCSEYIPIDTGSGYYTDMYYSYGIDGDGWCVNESSIKKPTVGDSTTIGESEPTNIRGDVNLDGKVNSADLLYLKKYLLGLIEW